MLIRIKKYIGLFFFWTFIVPQISNVLHFVIVPHNYSSKHNSKPDLIEKNDTHYCSQHLFNTTSIISANAIDISIPINIIYKSVIIQKNSFVLRLLNNGLFLRGPPTIKFF